ncbi:MAG: hypothetical protein MO853_03235 [Candidatus Protistobacter heckmanni]|nr:hypothetical protein [Candidatus Protistobacter heckmanni]
MKPRPASVKAEVPVSEVMAEHPARVHVVGAPAALAPAPAELLAQQAR